MCAPTLQPTALVHEAWLRIGAGHPPTGESRGHSFAAAAEVMRRILVEHARRSHQVKHGGEFQRVDIDRLDVALTTADDQLLSVSGALDQLAERDPIGAELIKLRFFAGPGGQV